MFGRSLSCSPRCGSGVLLRVALRQRSMEWGGGGWGGGGVVGWGGGGGGGGGGGLGGGVGSGVGGGGCVLCGWGGGGVCGSEWGRGAKPQPRNACGRRRGTEWSLGTSADAVRGSCGIAHVGRSGRCMWCRLEVAARSRWPGHRTEGRLKQSALLGRQRCSLRGQGYAGRYGWVDLSLQLASSRSVTSVRGGS